MRDMTDMATMKVSSRLHAFWTKGWNLPHIRTTFDQYLICAV